MAEQSNRDKAHEATTEMLELIKSAELDRAQWGQDVTEWFGYYMSDPTVVFGRDAVKSKETKKGAASLSQYHSPLVTEKGEAFVAAVNGSDIEIRVVPKLEQDSPEITNITRMMNAAFEASRTLIGWNNHMHLMAKNTYVFDRYYISPAVNFVKTFPDPLADLRAYNAWQLFHTPGVRYEDAREVVTAVWVSKEDLKAQFPEFTEGIEALPSFGDISSQDTSNKKVEPFSSSIRVIKTGVPGFGEQGVETQRDAIEVLERWKFDATLKNFSHEQDEGITRAENQIVAQAVQGGAFVDQNGQPLIDQQGNPVPDLLFEDRQRHSEHIPTHLELVVAMQARLAETQTVTEPFTQVRTEGIPVVGDSERGLLEQATALMRAHIELHQDWIDTNPPELEGKEPKFDGGWRQTTVLGGELMVFDGPSKFWTEFGIQGLPMEEFSIMGHPLHHWGPSLAGLLVDFNKIVDSLLNASKDNMNLFGSHSWWFREKVWNDPSTSISNDPRDPIIVPDDAFEGKDFGQIQASEIPQSALALINQALGLANNTAAIHPSLVGKQESGVRSGVQQQQLVSQNVSQLAYKMTRLKPAIERLATKWFKMVMQLPPDDTVIKPTLEGQFVPVDFDVLSSIDFVVEVVIQPGGTSALEDRNNITLGILQNLTPIFAQLGLIDVLVEFMADSTKLQSPDLSAALMQKIDQIRQAQAQQQQQAQAQAGAQQQGTQAPTR